MSKLVNKTSKKIMGFALALLLLVACVFFYNDFGINAGETAKAASSDVSIIRVLLSTMGSKTSVDITVNGLYSVQNITNADYAFRNGVLLRKQKYTFKVVDDNIVLSCDEGNFVLGNDITLYSHQAGRDSYLTMKNGSYYGTCNYLGNMRIYVSSGYLVFINELNLDDYLCGVVPYEMSNAQEVESLKVQAVCARSFAYHSVAANPNATYHVNDTTATQVYKGYNSSYSKCITAVDQTAYQVLTYNGQYISAYYSSSNGGLTETTANVWFASLPYYTIKVDEYDTVYRNRRYTISKTSISSQNASNLKNAAKTEITEKGYDYSTATVISIDHIVPTYHSEPKELAETERRVASIDIHITVKAKNTSTQVYETFACTVKKSKDAVRTFLLWVNPDGKDGSNLSSTRFKVEETDSQIIATSNGYGHGIGMSQNGVYARVAAGQTYKEILDFYYTGTTIKTLQYDTYIYKPVPSNEYIDSQISSFKTYENMKAGALNGVADIYENAGAIYSIIAQAESDTSLHIFGETDDWYAVSMNDGEVSGYVRKSCVAVVKEETPGVENGIMKMGVVTSEVWARSSATYTENNLLNKLSVGSEVIVLNDKVPFYEIYYNGASAYASSEYIRLTDEAVYSVSKAKVKVYKASLFGMADDASPKKGYLSKGTEIDVFNMENGFASCLYNGTISYVKADKLDFIEDEYGYAPLREITHIDVNLKIILTTDVYTASGEAPIDTLYENDIVRAVALENGRYKIIYGNGYAYIDEQNAIVYSENISIERAVALTDKLLYSSQNMSIAVGTLSAGDGLEVISSENGIVKVLFNGSICYMDSSNLVFTTEQAEIIK